MSWYEIEAAEAAEKAVAAFLQTEVANGNVSVDEAGSWTWDVNEFAWPIEVATDPSILDGQIAAGYGECEAYYPCNTDEDFTCAIHAMIENGGYDV